MFVNLRKTFEKRKKKDTKIRQKMLKSLASNFCRATKTYVSIHLKDNFHLTFRLSNKKP